MFSSIASIRRFAAVVTIATAIGATTLVAAPAYAATTEVGDIADFRAALALQSTIELTLTSDIDADADEEFMTGPAVVVTIDLAGHDLDLVGDSWGSLRIGAGGYLEVTDSTTDGGTLTVTGTDAATTDEGGTAGIHVSTGTFVASGTAHVIATGGSATYGGGAGIGGDGHPLERGEPGGVVSVVDDASVTAVGGDASRRGGGAGIGGGGGQQVGGDGGSTATWDRAAITATGGAGATGQLAGVGGGGAGIGGGGGFQAGGTGGDTTARDGSIITASAAPVKVYVGGGAGIGGGGGGVGSQENGFGGQGGITTVRDNATVIATGSSTEHGGGAGIGGGGGYGTGGAGGTTTASDGATITASGGTDNYDGSGAGIGGGGSRFLGGSSGTVTASDDATVIAKGGDSDFGGAAGIGGGGAAFTGGGGGSVTLSERATVEAHGSLAPHGGGAGIGGGGGTGGGWGGVGPGAPTAELGGPAGSLVRSAATSVTVTPVTGLGGANGHQVPVVSPAPDAGPVTGGTAVGFTGAGYEVGATAVDFGDTPGTDVTVSSESSLTVTTPSASAAGPVDVVVTTSTGRGTLLGGFRYHNPVTAADRSITVAQDSGATVIPVAVTGDDLQLSVEAVGSGSATVSGDTIVYTPPPGFSGTDNVTYRASNGFATATATVTITVSPTTVVPPVVQPPVTPPTTTPPSIAAPPPALPAVALDVSVSRTLVVTGSKTTVRATGLAAGERYRIRIGSTTVARGAADDTGAVTRRVTVPKNYRDGPRTVTVRGSRADRVGSDDLRVVAKNKVLRATVIPSTTVGANRDVTIRVSKLAPAEAVKIVYNGRSVTPKDARANAKGRYTVRVSAGWNWGSRTATITGLTAHRTTTLRIIVGPR